MTDFESCFAERPVPVRTVEKYRTAGPPVSPRGEIVCRVPDQNTWTGRHILSLVRVYKTETAVDNIDRELVDRIERAISWLYARGRRRRRKRKQV